MHDRADARRARRSPLASVRRLAARSTADKRALVALMRRHRAELAPGVWVLPSLGYAARAGVPRRGHDAGSRWTRIRGGVLQRLVLRTVVAIAPPALAVVRGRGARRGVTSALATKAGGLVLFDARLRTVVHLPANPYRADYGFRRSALAAVLPVPDWEMSGDRLRLVETFCRGASLRAVAPDRRRAVAREFLLAYRDLIAGGAHGDSVAALDAALLTFDREAGHDTRLGWLAPLRARLREAAATWPLVAAHGDLTAENVVVGGSFWHLIDFEDTADLPYFFDAICLLGGDDESRNDLLNGCLAALDDAAGAPAGGGALRILATALIAAHRHTVLHDGPFLASFERLHPVDGPIADPAAGS